MNHATKLADVSNGSNRVRVFEVRVPAGHYTVVVLNGARDRRDVIVRRFGPSMKSASPHAAGVGEAIRETLTEKGLI